jgi:O-antigen ligase
MTTPHSTYLGTVAEFGAAGLAALVLLLLAGNLGIRRLRRSASVPRWEAAAYAGAGVAFLIEAIATDLLNCRHYWWFFAIIAARVAGSAPGKRGAGRTAIHEESTGR